MKQRIISFLLIVFLLFGSTVPALAEDKIKDVSKNHWAYESVVKLVDHGYLSLYDGSKFKGETSVSRYQLAKAVYKILEEVEKEQISLKEKDILTLKKLATEFRSELVEVMSQSKEVQQEVDKLSKKQTINQEDIINTNDRVNKLTTELNKLVNELKKEAAKLTKLKQRIDKLETSNQELRERVNNIESNLSDKGTEKEVQTLQRRFYWLGAGLSIGLLLLVNN
ncbi:hypothetical protein JCM16358_26500 [Halanaerocella petrolearia]